MKGKNNKNTVTITSDDKYDIVVRNFENREKSSTKRDCTEVAVHNFVRSFYEKHGKVMSRLAYE